MLASSRTERPAFSLADDDLAALSSQQTDSALYLSIPFLHVFASRLRLSSTTNLLYRTLNTTVLIIIKPKTDHLLFRTTNLAVVANLRSDSK